MESLKIESLKTESLNVRLPVNRLAADGDV